MRRDLFKIVVVGALLGCNAARIFADEVCVHGMVVSVNPMATAAGLNVLKSGGNAVDAAVAAGLTLGVTDTANSGIGGGCFMLIHLANGRNIAIDGREMAPATATRDMFIRNGKGDVQLSQTGPLASGVPGEVAAFDYAVRHYGKKSLKQLILPAADIAEQGFRRYFEITRVGWNPSPRTWRSSPRRTRSFSPMTPR